MFLHNKLPLTVLISVRFSYEAALGENQKQRARKRRAYSKICALEKLTNKYVDNDDGFRHIALVPDF